MIRNVCNQYMIIMDEPTNALNQPLIFVYFQLWTESRDINDEMMMVFDPNSVLCGKYQSARKY